MNALITSFWVYLIYTIIGSTNVHFPTENGQANLSEESISITCPSTIELPCNTDPEAFPPPDFSQVEVVSTCPLQHLKHIGDEYYGQSGCKILYTRTFEALDECGNYGRCVSFLTFCIDEEPPTVEHCQLDLDLGCNVTEFPEITAELVGATDNCGEVSIVILTDNENVNGCRHVKNIRYAVVDKCGNQTVCRIRFIWYEDEVPPTVDDCERVVDLGCNPKSIPEPNPKRLKSQDDCGPVISEAFPGDIIVEGCQYRLTYTYIYRDRCENELKCTETFVWIDDTIPPVVFNCSDTIDLGCNPPEIPDFDSTLILAEDNCEGPIRITLLNSTDRGNTCDKRRIYRFAVRDACNNRTVCRLVYIWTEDTEPPVVENCEREVDLGCNPRNIPEPNPNRLRPTDNCGQVISESFPGDIVVEGCSYSLTYTYIYKDQCGNEIKCFENFRWMVDKEPPHILNCQEGGLSIELGCLKDTSEIPPALPAPLIIEDNCSQVDVILVNEIFQFEECCGRIIRRYRVIDSCGNRANCRVILNFCVDGEAPEIFCPEPEYLGCIIDLSEVPQPNPERIKAKDFCGEVEVEFEERFLERVVCEYKLVYIYKATDGCGNMARCEEIFTFIVDTIPPQVECPEPIDFGCVDGEFSPPEPDTSRIKYRDNCGIAEVKIPPVDIVVINCTYHLTWVYIFVDHCGNETICFETFTWTIDELVPEIICPEPEYLGCISSLEEVPAPDTGRVKTKDFCGEVKVQFDERYLEGEACEYKLVYVYKATDACGNMARCEEVFKFRMDTIPPKVVCEDLDLGCNPEYIPQITLEDIQWSDDCGEVEIINPISAISFEGCDYKISQAFDLIDQCFNVTHCYREITYRLDTVPPDVVCKDLDLGCNPEYIPQISLDDIQWSDNCGTVEIVNPISAISFEDCDYKISQAFDLVDICGNATHCYREITYTMDTIPPKVVCEDIDLGCNPEYIPQISLDDIEWSDNCGGVEIGTAISAIAFEGCNYIISQAFNLVDGCGNVTHCSRQITYTLDTLPPEVRCVDLDLGCNPDSIPSIEDIPIKDNCGGDVNIVEAASSIRLEGCTTVITQSLTAVDSCGNSTYCEREIRYISDTTGPVILECPDSIHLGCNPQEIPGFDVTRVKVADDCGIADTLFAFVDYIPNGCEYQVGHLYIFIDSCGNRSECLEIFAWTLDDGPPVFRGDYCTTLQSNPDLGCTSRGEEMLAIFIDSITNTISDNCGIFNVEVDVSLPSIDGCHHTRHVKITAIDGCDQSTVCEGDVSWTYVNPDIPEYEFPADITVFDCEEPEPPVFNNDNCGPCTMNLVFTIDGGCQNGVCVIFRLWVKECCGKDPLSQFQRIEIRCEPSVLQETGEKPISTDGDKTNVIRLNNPIQSEQEFRDLLAENGELRLFPNPTTSSINVNLSGLKSSRNLELRVFDDHGKLHLEQKYQQTSSIHEVIELDDFKTGPYTLVISDGNQIWYKRFLRIE